MPIDMDALTTSLRRLAAHSDSGEDVVASLKAVTEACVALFGVAGSGIMIADEQNITRYVAASDGSGRALETMESETGEGPCTDAFVLGRPVTTPDLQTDTRWPTLARAVAGLDVRAVLGVPLRLGAITVGTLDVYRDRPQEWEDGEQAALVRYSGVVETTLTAALSAHKANEIADQLQYALDYRVIIERGVGYLMARDRVDPVMAFNRLRRAARDSQTRIGEVASSLLASGRLPNEPTG
jgi:transcriptional regulator with GAF, ATPase, and Fis domain